MSCPHPNPRPSTYWVVPTPPPVVDHVVCIVTEKDTPEPVQKGGNPWSERGRHVTLISRVGGPSGDVFRFEPGHKVRGVIPVS